MADKTVGYIQSDCPADDRSVQYLQILNQVISVLDDLIANKDNLSLSCDARTFKQMVNDELITIKTSYLKCSLARCNFRLEINSLVDYSLKYERYPLYITFLQSK